jgi:hypothetical protein
VQPCASGRVDGLDDEVEVDELIITPATPRDELYVGSEDGSHRSLFVALGARGVLVETLVKSGPAAVDQAESPPDHSRQFVQRCQTSPLDYLRSRVVLPSTVLHVCTACLRTAPSRSRQCRAISSSTRHRP